MLQGAESESVQLCATPWTVARQAPLSMGFSSQEYRRGLPFPSPKDLPNPGSEPGSPGLQTDSLPSEPPGATGGWGPLVSMILRVREHHIILLTMDAVDIQRLDKQLIKQMILILILKMWKGFPWRLSGKESACQCRR